jgi:hypothetical protein
MKILLSHSHKQEALTLVGLIVGIMLIIVGCTVVFLLMRLAKVKPRELPDPEADEWMQQEYGTNWQSRDWPVQFVPEALSLITPAPSGDVYEKVFIDNDFLVQKCIDGTLTNWWTEFHWIIGGSGFGGSLDDQGIPWVFGFAEFESEGVTYRMKDDYSGFDIQVAPEVMATNQAMFWRTTK